MTISTPADARAASEHVLYEIEMFCSIATHLETGVVDDAVRSLEHEGLVVRNAMIEAFQLHARQLIDLLTRPDRRDMSASDFTEKKWRQLRWSQRRRADFERFSQRVMHLSLRRADFTANQQRVHSRRVRRDLGNDIRRFLDAVDQGRVCNDFLVRARLALTLSELPTEQAHGVVGAIETMTGYTGGAISTDPTEGEIGYTGGTATSGLPAYDVR
jgi:hypothetical protein